jgi:hypothetical protein
MINKTIKYITLACVALFAMVALATTVSSPTQESSQFEGSESLMLDYAKGLIALKLSEAMLSPSRSPNITIELRPPASFYMPEFYPALKESFAVSGHISKELRTVAAYYGCTINSVQGGDRPIGANYTLSLTCKI